VEGFGVGCSPTFARVLTVLHSPLICSLCTALYRSLPSALLHELLQFLADSSPLSRNEGEWLLRFISATHPPLIRHIL
jgi:hypothetical protein